MPVFTFTAGKLEWKDEIIVEVMVDKGYKLPTRTYLRPTLQYINALGGGVLLDMFNEDEIKKLTFDYITMRYEGKDSVVIDEENEELEEDYDLEDI